MKNFNPLAAGTECLDWSKEPLLNYRVRKFYDEKSAATQVIRPERKFTELEKDVNGRILIIDDDQFSLAAATAPLIKMNYDVTVAGTYKEALKYITEHPFDLVILDYVLADATGYDVLKKSEEIMGSLYAQNTIPVVTYSTQEQQHILMPELSIFNYLGHWKKPLKRKEIYKLVKTL